MFIGLIVFGFKMFDGCCFVVDVEIFVVEIRCLEWLLELLRCFLVLLVFGIGVLLFWIIGEGVFFLWEII